MLLLISILDLCIPASAQELKPTSHLPLIERGSDRERDFYVIFLTGNGGYRNLARSVTDYINHKHVTMVVINTKKYLWKKKNPDQIACDLERLIDVYNEKLALNRVVLMGYSMGAEVLPFAIDFMEENYLRQLEDIILIGPWQKATFKINLLDYFLEIEKGADIYSELKEMKSDKGYVICDDNKYSICRKDLSDIIDHDVLGGGHHFGGDYEVLSEMICKRLKLE